MKHILVLSIICITLLSCEQKNKKNQLTGKWQAIALENAELDSLMKQQLQFLDTFGSNTTPEENETIYGFRNIDSARTTLKAELEEYLAMQDHAVKHTWFDFRKDGVVVMNFSGQIDSSKWYINDDGALMLDELEMKGAGARIKMEILSLTDTSLRLQLNDEGMSSVVLFEPSDK